MCRSKWRLRIACGARSTLSRPDPRRASARLPLGACTAACRVPHTITARQSWLRAEYGRITSPAAQTFLPPSAALISVLLTFAPRSLRTRGQT